MFFLGGGRAGEFWYFSQKKVLALPHVLIKKLLTLPLLGDWQVWPSPRYRIKRNKLKRKNLVC